MFKLCLVTKPFEVFSSATEWPNASPLFIERETEKFVEDKEAKNTKRSAELHLRVERSALIFHKRKPHPQLSSYFQHGKHSSSGISDFDLIGVLKSV